MVLGIPRTAVPCAPIDKVQIRIVSAGNPSGRSTELVGVSGPGITTRLARSGCSIPAPKVFAALRIPTVDEAPGTVLTARDAGHHHAVGDKRHHGHGIAVGDIGRLGTPQLLAGSYVQGDDVNIQGRPVKLAFVQSTATVEDAAAYDAGGLRGILDSVNLELTARLRIDSVGFIVGGDIHDTVVNQRLRLLAAVVAQGVVPNRHQALDGFLVELHQRAVTLLAVAHSQRQHVVGGVCVLGQACRRLCAGRTSQQTRHKTASDCQADSFSRHSFPKINFLPRFEVSGFWFYSQVSGNILLWRARAGNRLRKNLKTVREFSNTGVDRR